MRTCTVDGCNRQYLARGYCSTHYAQARRGLEPGKIRPMGREGCEVESCDGSHYARGYCGKHYANFMRMGEPMGRNRVTVKMDSSRFRAALILRRHTYTSIGQKLDVSRQRIEQLQRNRMMPDTFTAIAEVLDVSPSWLRGDEPLSIPPFTKENQNGEKDGSGGAAA